MAMDYSVVAFLDVLGFSAMVEQDSTLKEQKFLPMFVEIFSELAQDVHEQVSLRMFSDSIIVEATLNPANFAKVLEVVGILQRRFLQRHVLLRGGVAFGKHYRDDFVTFSQALVAAYEIESRVARVPRVVVSPDLLNYAWHDVGTTEEMRTRLCGLLTVDRDRATFVNYLEAAHLPPFRGYVEACLAIEPHPREAVMEKLRWLLDYYNYQASNTAAEPIQSAHLMAGFSPLSAVT